MTWFWVFRWVLTCGFRVTVLLRIDLQLSMKGNGGFCNGFCLCGDLGRGDCFGGGFSSGGTDFVR